MRFPRLRGDEPDGAYSCPHGSWFSPPTRGWALVYGIDLSQTKVFPAYAGMSLRIVWEDRLHRCFPRLRGDEPGEYQGWFNSNRFSPPTRG